MQNFSAPFHHLLGIVRTTQKLDREAKHEHILEITAQSRVNSTTQVFIEVDDVNDNIPAFGSKVNGKCFACIKWV